MRSVVFATLAGLIALFVVASPKPASALPATAAVNHSQADASDVIEVRRWYKRRYYRPYRYRYYGRPYYRPYGYYRRPYYRPYRYYGRPYYRPYYYRRPRVSVYVGI